MPVKGAAIFNSEQNRLNKNKYRNIDHYTVFKDFIFTMENTNNN